MSEETENPDSPEGEENAEAYAPDPIGENTGSAVAAGDHALDAVLDVPVQLALRVGETTLCIRDLLQLVEGSVVELDRGSTEPMDVLVNDQAVARGEIVVVGDNFGVRLTDIISGAEAALSA